MTAATEEQEHRLLIDALYSLRSQILGRGWRVSENHWRRLSQIDNLIKKLERQSAHA